MLMKLVLDFHWCWPVRLLTKTKLRLEGVPQEHGEVC